MAEIDIDKEEAELDAFIAKKAEEKQAEEEAEEGGAGEDDEAADEAGSTEDPAEDEGADEEEENDDAGEGEELPDADTEGGDEEEDEAVILTAKQEKRVKDLQRKMTKATTATKALEAKNEQLEQLLLENLGNKSEGKQTEEAGADVTEETEASINALDEVSEEFEALKKEFPEVTPALQKIFESLNKQIMKLDGDLKISKRASAQNIQESAQFLHESTIESKHSGFKQTVASEEFGEYLEGLNPRMKAFTKVTLDSGTAADVIEMLDDFAAKVAVSQASIDKQKKADKVGKAKGHVVPSVGKQTKKMKLATTKGFVTQSEIRKMSDADFEKHEAEFDKLLGARKIV